MKLYSQLAKKGTTHNKSIAASGLAQCSISSSNIVQLTVAVVFLENNHQGWRMLHEKCSSYVRH